MMNLIDRAASALATFQVGEDGWQSLDAAVQDEFRTKVRVILEAIRDPDQAMTEAGAEIIRSVGQAESDVAHLSDAANTWRFMIDALVEMK